PKTGLTSRVTTAVPMNSQRTLSMPRSMPSASRAGRSIISALRMQKKNRPATSTGASSPRRRLNRSDTRSRMAAGSGEHRHQFGLLRFVQQRPDAAAEIVDLAFGLAGGRDHGGHRRMADREPQEHLRPGSYARVRDPCRQLAAAG